MNYELRIKNKSTFHFPFPTFNFQLSTFKPNRGFSLFELIVVLSIAAVVSAITFSNFPKMNSKLSLDLLAQDIAITLRQAQVYGTTVMGTGANTENFDSYGVSFPNPTDAYFVNGTKDYKYTIFADLSAFDPTTETIETTRQGFYNEGTEKCMDRSDNCLDVVPCGPPVKLSGGAGENECFQPYVVNSRNKIKAICLNYINDANKTETKESKIADCTTNHINIKEPDQGATVDIAYKRPRMQASFRTKVNGNFCYEGYCDGDPIQNIGIVVESEDGTESRVVVVWTNGQIAVER